MDLYFYIGHNYYNSIGEEESKKRWYKRRHNFTGLLKWNEILYV